MTKFVTPEMPEIAEIIDITVERPDTKTFTVRYLDPKLQKKFSFMPGKFMMVSVFGHGEIPISITSSPYKTETIRFTVVNVGNVTNAMHNLKKGELIGLRGPFGNGFPMQRFRKKNIVFVTGGCGLAPLRSAIYAVQAKRDEFGQVLVLFGCKTPQQLLFREDLDNWGRGGFSVLLTIDNPDETWRGSAGPVTAMISKTDMPLENTAVLLCGPPNMIKFSIIELRKKGFKAEQIFASLERMMQCGVGYCSHCNAGDKYTCIHGPVFSASELDRLPLEED